LTGLGRTAAIAGIVPLAAPGSTERTGRVQRFQSSVSYSFCVYVCQLSIAGSASPNSAGTAVVRIRPRCGREFGACVIPSNTPALPFVHDSSDNLGFSPEEEHHGAHSYARYQDRS
jgi:hypothetical protein